MALWTFTDDEGTAYYGRSEDGRWYWFGEKAGTSPGGHPLAETAHVFAGREQSDGRIDGAWWDVPKGSRSRGGEMASWRYDAAPGGFGFPELSFTRGSHPGGGPLRSSVTAEQRLDARAVPAGFIGAADSLTGNWISDSGAYYYIRQEADDVIWFGEKKGSDDEAVFSNVFVGKRSDAQVAGSWVDVPKGDTERMGHLDMRLENAWTLRRRRETGGFLDQWWHRVDSFWVDLCLFRLDIRESEDVFGDEPLLWFAYFKQDGDWVDWSGHAGEPAPFVTIRPDDSEANRVLVRPLTSDDDESRPCRDTFRPSGIIFRGGGGFDTGGSGTDGLVRIPAKIGAFSTVLSTTRGFDPASEWARGTTHLGLIACAWDQDFSSEESTRAAFSTFRSEVRRQLELRTQRWFSWLVPGASEPPSLDEIATSAGHEADERLLDLDSWTTDSHDLIGAAQISFRLSDFRDGARQRIALTIAGDGAIYDIGGEAIPEFRAFDPGSL